MAGKTNIEWTEQSWNPLAGCTVLTPGCRKCYAMKMAARLEKMGQSLYAGLTEPSKAGPVWTGVMRQASDDVLLSPLRRRKPTTYFVNSMSDLFHESVPDEWIDRVFAVMALCTHHTFQILTKRAARMRDYLTEKNSRPIYRAAILPVERLQLCAWAKSLSDEMIPGYPHDLKPLPNVWLGVSTERQQEADQRIPDLLQTPAAVRFISAEPLLGPIRLNSIHVPEKAERHDGPWSLCWDALTGFRATSPYSGTDNNSKLDWVIVGGESGPGARPMDVAWARSLRDQCSAAGVSFFMKQLSGPSGRAEKDIAHFPSDLQVREMPNAA